MHIFCCICLLLKRKCDNVLFVKSMQLLNLSVFIVYKDFLIVKLREREGQGVDPGRSLKGHL